MTCRHSWPFLIPHALFPQCQLMRRLMLVETQTNPYLIEGVKRAIYELDCRYTMLTIVHISNSCTRLKLVSVEVALEGTLKFQSKVFALHLGKGSELGVDVAKV